MGRGQVAPVPLRITVFNLFVWFQIRNMYKKKKKQRTKKGRTLAEKVLQPFFYGFLKQNKKYFFAGPLTEPLSKKKFFHQRK